MVKARPDAATVLAACALIAGARNKEELIEVLWTRLKGILPFNDFKISVVLKDQYCHSPLAYEYEARRKSHKDFQYLVKKTHRVTPELAGLLERKEILVQSVAGMLQRDEVPDYAPFYEATGIREVVVCPMSDAKDTLSILILANEQAGRFTSDDLGFLKEVAGILGITVANILAREEIELREKEKSLLLEFSNNLATVRDTRALGLVIGKGLRELFQIEEFLLSKIDEDGKTNSFYIFDEHAEYFDKSGFKDIQYVPIPMEKSFAEKVFATPEPLRFDFLHLYDDVILRGGSADFWVSVGLRHILGIALRVADRNIGVLWVQPYLKTNEGLVHVVAAQIGMAVANTVANEKIESQLKKISAYQQQLEREKKYLQDEIKLTYNYSEIIGNSPAMEAVFSLVARVASSSSSVLLLGDTGTGKELIARAIHMASARRDKMMVKVNCATLPANLIESELFGHERGSFTGATDRRIGKFELANGGTLFLDEIGEMPVELQVKLLRALQEREIERIGGRNVIKTDVRVVAATNKDLALEVEEGRFRRDLFFRLNVFPITLPALASRRDDIPLLVQHFIYKYASNADKHRIRFSAEAMKQLIAYDWPGNVRELEHMVERCLLLADGPVITDVPLPAYSAPTFNKPANASTDDTRSIDDVERDYILKVLRDCKGKIAGPGGAAERLQIPSTTLNSKMKRLRIQKGYYGD